MLLFSIRNLTIAVLAVTIAGCGGGTNTPPPPPPVVIIDTDQDGVADSVDAAPNDPLCAAASDASNGVCYLKTLASSRLKIVGNANGKIVFNSEDDALRLYTYDLNTKHFLGRVNITGYTPTTYAYSADHARVYVGDTDGKIHSYSESLQESATIFASVPSRINGLVAVGKYLMAQDDTGAWESHHLFDKQGAKVESKDWNYYSRYYDWNQATSTLYFFRDNSSPNDLMFEVIDQATGKITSSGESPYHGSYTITGPIRSNAAGTKILLGSGDIYAAPGLTWQGNIGATPTDAAWIANDELLTFSPSGDKTRLTRYSANRTKMEELLVNGEVLGVSIAGSVNYLVVKKATQIEIVNYVPSNDTDGDGVTNLADKFPLDKTAAVDSDNDGYPDAFLGSYTAADSPTGLTKDFYPNDANCHALDQGDGVNCNAALATPAYVPDQIFSDSAGTIYLLSRENGRLYRWSKTAGAYLAPLVIGQKVNQATMTPDVVALSTGHNRIYFGYKSGLITYISLAGDPRETPFVAVATRVRGLASVGNYLLAQDDSGAWATHYTFDSAAKLIDSKEWNYFSRSYAWNPTQSRVYFFRDDTSPNDVMYETIDQATGKIVGNGESPYHGDYSINGPIRVSTGGGRIVIGSGYIFSTSDLKMVKSLGTNFVDAQWLDDGSLVTIASTGTGNAKVTLYNASFAVVKDQVFAGAPQSLVKTGGSIFAVTGVGGKPVISLFAL
ncbi:hypothetical protein [Duganella sp. HH101]|uniref:hypothetical protein n=1 Tax=Duganella sp. HH101 TaxID=1781066 RepID=UPI000874ED59|nr:hypothetical protein [Duganella sp. HH101]OFA04592.1 hypothetical protein DUGA2_21380 [Duganella sp. HH101]